MSSKPKAQLHDSEDIGFSFLARAALMGYLPDAKWQHAIASLGYAVGFIIVILGHQRLFTEAYSKRRAE